MARKKVMLKARRVFSDEFIQARANEFEKGVNP
jgi:hypothetical protein